MELCVGMTDRMKNGTILAALRKLQGLTLGYSGRVVGTENMDERVRTEDRPERCRTNRMICYMMFDL